MIDWLIPEICANTLSGPCVPPKPLPLSRVTLLRTLSVGMTLNPTFQGVGPTPTPTS